MKDLFIYAGAYLIGSIPVGLWLMKGLRGIDLRKKKDGNIGMAGIWKFAGKNWGLAVLGLDFLKGAAAVSLAHAISPEDAPDWVFAGFLAILGDEFPVFLKFKGNRAIGTTMGAFAALLFWMLVK